MLVRDLIERLKEYPEDMEVHLAYGYGDYWRTTVAPKITSVSEGEVERSDYYQMDKLITIEEDYDDEDTGETRTVRRVVILD